MLHDNKRTKLVPAEEWNVVRGEEKEIGRREREQARKMRQRKSVTNIVNATFIRKKFTYVLCLFFAHCCSPLSSLGM